MWCHNPEGQSLQPEVIHSPAGERLAGREWTSVELAARLNQQAGILSDLSFFGLQLRLGQQKRFAAKTSEELPEGSAS
jgi:hypothetical protein